MNFKKFSKTVTPEGYIYNEGDIHHWLTDGTVFMVIPENLSVGGRDLGELPDEVKRRIRAAYTVEAHLHNAILPDADSKIKDAVRVYRDDEGYFNLGISNDAWNLIEPKKDRVFIAYDPDNTPLALIVTDFDENIVGAVLSFSEV